jgi:orotidine-5'-phosphate decarboxylase
MKRSVIEAHNQEAAAGRAASNIVPAELSAENIIVALDVANADAALDLVNRLRSTISRFKVGLQLYIAAGPPVVTRIIETGARVFLDLKLHDIPNTVGGAVESAASLGVEMLTVHLTGGQAMVRAAVEAAQQRLMIIGVTVLTSHDHESLRRVGVIEGTEKQVGRLARLAVECGAHGLVVSPHETAMIRSQFGRELIVITPGIRPAGADAGDQKRVATPHSAIRAGADYLVIGRPINRDPDPVGAVHRILAGE